MAQHNNFHSRRASADGLHHHLNLKSWSPTPVLVWDSGSSLYDSYELSTFTQHLQRAIAAAGSSLQSASIVKDGHARSFSMPNFAFTTTAVKQEKPMAIIDFSPSPLKIEPLQPKRRGRLRVPKLVQRLFTRLARDGQKQHDNLHSAKVGRSSFERVFSTALHYC